MTVELYAHQKDALQFIAPMGRGRAYYALLMEQGTGKTPVVIHDAARRWQQRECDGLLVFAPNGVHTNWTLREIPMHMPVECAHAAWYSGATRAEERALEGLFSADAMRGPLRALTMNWEALHTKDGWEMALRFAMSVRQLFIAGDESQRIKNPKAQSTKALFKLKAQSAIRAILSGTAIVQSPWDAFSQFGFLSPRILETTSYTAFKAEYAELIQGEHLRHILMRSNSEEAAKAKMKYTRIVARDPVTGLPKWRNLEKLNKLIEPYSFRVLKEDCLDLPAKVYTQTFFRMTTQQRKQYVQLREELRLHLEDGTIAPVERLAAITKLSQVVSGYFIVPGTKDQINPIMPREDNPKLKMLMQEIESSVEAGSQVIVWARFQNEIRDICKTLADAGIKHVEYHGAVSQSLRQIAIDAFQSGAARVFVGQQAAGGTGITLTAASTVIYYSNTWSLADRLQSDTLTSSRKTRLMRT
jgi:hypothetical protein